MIAGSVQGIRLRAIYCGMPNEKTFSVGAACGAKGNFVNVFYPVKINRINLYIGINSSRINDIYTAEFHVRYVTSEELSLECVDKFLSKS